MEPESPERVLVTHVTTRGYELAASGTLPPSAFLRYLEHQRWQAMADDAAVPIRRFWPMGVVRAQRLELYQSIGFHEELRLVLWLSRVGRTSCDLSHAIHRAGDGELVGRSTATVVALDTARRPRAIAPEARDFVVERPLCRVASPEGPAPAGCWSRDVQIRPSDHDLQQHVNQARYADYVDDARLLCARAGGYAADGADATGTVRGLYLSYEREARAGDALTVRTWRASGSALDFELSVGTNIATRARVELGPLPVR